MTIIVTRSQIEKVRARKLRIALHIHQFTGEWAIPPHPYIRTLRLCWSSNAPAGSIPANHVRFNPHH